MQKNQSHDFFDQRPNFLTFSDSETIFSKPVADVAEKTLKVIFFQSDCGSSILYGTCPRRKASDKLDSQFLVRLRSKQTENGILSFSYFQKVYLRLNFSRKSQSDFWSFVNLSHDQISTKRIRYFNICLLKHFISSKRPRRVNN